MLDSVYEWIRDLASCLVVVTVVLEVIPGNGYKKYIRFFTGLVMLLLLLTPVLRLTGTERKFTLLYHQYEWEQAEKERERETEEMSEADILDFLPSAYPGGQNGGQTGGQDSGETATEESGGAKDADRREKKEAVEEPKKIRVEDIRIGE